MTVLVRAFFPSATEFEGKELRILKAEKKEGMEVRRKATRDTCF
jgi:hypothetical protein